MAAMAMATRERILAAAAEVFGQHGFRAATVRQIARQAEANVAAVNYYFRDKQGLYTAVLEQLLDSGLRQFPSDGGLMCPASPEQRLEMFVRSFFQRMLGPEGSASVHSRGRLMAKELSDPSPALDHLITRYIRPQKELLADIVAELAGAASHSPQVTMCVLSIIGQCLYYAYARPIIERLAPELFASGKHLDRLASHVTRFSLAGIRQPPNGPHATHPGDQS